MANLPVFPTPAEAQQALAGLPTLKGHMEARGLATTVSHCIFFKQILIPVFFQTPASVGAAVLHLTLVSATGHRAVRGHRGHTFVVSPLSLTLHQLYTHSTPSLHALYNLSTRTLLCLY